ncbi:MAG: AMP-binding protein [Treponema sp.]|nr:AMP-binding protein [Treponema sp.]
MLREKAVKNGGREFLVYPNRNIRYTFAGFDKKVDALAKGLLAAGFKKGSHIGIWANNVPEWTTVFFAAARIGVVAVPINSSYKQNELAYVIGQADIKGLFIIDRYRNTDYTETIYQLIPELKCAAAGGLTAAQFPCLKMIVNIDNTQHEGMYTLEKFLQTGGKIPDSELQKAESQVSSDDILCIMYTSGTTGSPKGAMLTHRNIINNAYFATDKGRATENAVFLNPLPLFHIMAFNGVIESLIYGCKSAILEQFDPIVSLTTIQNEKCTWIYGVPALYMAILSHPQLNTFNTESLQYCSFGGSLCTPAMLANVMEKTHIKDIYIGYGLTETSPLVTDSWVNDSDQEGLITIGRPIQGVEVSIRDANALACPSGGSGEICVKGHNVMKGYYKMEAATREVIDKDGWFHTGDLGHFLPNGCLVIDGRIKELIIRGGENIYPKEVENLLLALPGIKDAQVAGIPSNKYGEEVGAFIILKEGASIGEREIRDFCREKISSFKIPKYIFFVDSFPITPSGKVQKFKLSELGEKEVR